MDTRTLWLIPARGGSKGIPDKNIRPFCGRPLVSRAVDQAMALAAPGDRVLLSTDSEAIAEVGRRSGDVVPFMRPAHLATDTASTRDVIVDAIETLAQRGEKFDRVVLLQPTSPFRTLADIRDAMTLWTPAVDMVVTVSEAKANPYFNAFEADADGLLHLSKGDGSYTRRQDAPKVWEYNGAVYVITTDSVLRSPMSKFDRIVPSVMDSARSVDLDTPADWEIAELLMNRKNG